MANNVSFPVTCQHVYNEKHASGKLSFSGGNDNEIFVAAVARGLGRQVNSPNLETSWLQVKLMVDPNPKILIPNHMSSGEFSI